MLGRAVSHRELCGPKRSSQRPAKIGGWIPECMVERSLIQGRLAGRIARVCAGYLPPVPARRALSPRGSPSSSPAKCFGKPPRTGPSGLGGGQRFSRSDAQRRFKGDLPCRGNLGRGRSRAQLLVNFTLSVSKGRGTPSTHGGTYRSTPTAARSLHVAWLHGLHQAVRCHRSQPSLECGYLWRGCTSAG